MGKYKVPKLTQDVLNQYYAIISRHELISIEDAKINIRNEIVTDIVKNKSILKKISYMMYRNNIGAGTNLSDDILQQLALGLCSVNVDELFVAYCDDVARVIGLSNTILSGSLAFGKMNKDISPRQGALKSYLYSSNYQSKYYLSTVFGYIVYSNSTEEIDDVSETLLVEDESELDKLNKMFDDIYIRLDEENKIFMDFLLDRVFNKDRTSLSFIDRKNIISFTEYKIKKSILRNKIIDIIKEINQNE